MSPLAIEPLGPGEAQEEDWDSFLLAQRGGLLYHSIGYRNLLVDHLGCEAEYLVAREGEKIQGALPIMWTGDQGGRVCNSLPFYGSHGGVLAASPEAEAALLQAWNERATDSSTLAATMVGNPFLERQPPEPAHGLTDERISQVTELPGEDAEALMAIYSKNARRDVRRAERRGVEVGLDPDAMGDLGRIHRENISSVGGLPKSPEFFEAIPRHFSAGDDFDLWVGRLDGAIIAALLVMYFNDVAEYFTPAVDPDHRADEPMALILMRSMLEAARRGCRLWNWGGTWSSQDGVFRFKRKWGARESSYRYFVQVNDERLTQSSPEELRERFPHFYVVPFSALNSQEVTP